MPEPNLSIPKMEIEDVSETINKAFEEVMIPLQEYLQSQRSFDRLMVAYYVLNVWSLINTHVSSPSFTLTGIGDRLTYFSDMHVCFKDGVSVSEWIKENDSYSKLDSISTDSLKERLSELLMFIE